MELAAQPSGASGMSSHSKEWLDILEVSSEAVRIVSGALRLEVSHTPKRDLQP